jgi:hypothetical protein
MRRLGSVCDLSLSMNLPIFTISESERERRS